MITIPCPKCRDIFTINIANAIDEFGEVFMCSHCHFKFRYAER